MYKKGELGKIQHLAASHPQDMDGWPSYWEKMIPMHYATHVVSPCLGLVDGVAEYVSCFGSGTVRDDIAKKSGNKFAVESCHIKIKDSDVACHIWRFLYDVARQYRESFDVYGTKKSFEWTLVEHEPHVIHTAEEAGAGDSGKGRGAGFRPPAAGADPPVHAAAGNSRRQAPVVHPGRRARRFASAPGERVRFGPRRRSRPVAECHAVGQLDVRRHLRPSVGREGRRDRATYRSLRWRNIADPTATQGNGRRPASVPYVCIASYPAQWTHRAMNVSYRSISLQRSHARLRCA